MSLAALFDVGRILSLLAIGLLCGVLVERQQGPLERSFAATVCAIAAWSVVTIAPKLPNGDLLAPVLETRVVTVVGFAAGATAPILFFVYASQYTGRQQWSSPRKLGILLSPIGLLVGLLTAGIVTGTVREGIPSVLFGFVSIVVYLYVSVVFTFGTYRLWKVARRYQPVLLTQVGVVAAAVAAPYVGLFVSSVSEPAEDGTTVEILAVDLVFVGVLVSAVLVGYALRRYPLFTAFPESEYVARDEVLEELDDGVVILDAEGQIIDLNAAAAELCSRQPESVIGSDVRSVFPELPALPVETDRRVSLETAAGRREFEIRTSSITDDGVESIGWTLLLGDITQKRTREQRLEVLARVLRHNLRNSLDTVLAHSEEIDDAETRTAIQEELDELAETGRKAREIEAVLSVAESQPESVDLSGIVRGAAEQLQSEHETCEVTVDAPDDLTLLSHRRLLARLVSELLENAVEHNDSPQPSVAVTVESVEEGDAIEFTVVDNGPGIPRDEYTAIRDGTETSLSHGTGIGLWLVQWIVVRLGGELTFGDDCQGGKVVVWLPTGMAEMA